MQTHQPKLEEATQSAQQDETSPRRFSLSASLRVAALALATGGCSNANVERPEVARELSSKNLLVSKDVTFGVVTKSDALAGIREGKFDRDVLEVENVNSGALFYAFKESSSKKVYLLRISPHEKDHARDELVEKITAAGGKVSAGFTPASELGESSSWPWYYYVLGFLAASTIISAGENLYKKFAKKEENNAEKFADVGGNYELLSEMRMLAIDINAYKNGEDVELPRGCLLVGAPGTGKTFMARVLAGEVNCPVIVKSASALMNSSFVGAWSSEVEEVFEEARGLRDKDKPFLEKMGFRTPQTKKRGVVIVVLDEFEALGRQRSGAKSDAADQMRDRAVNALLTEMDGMDSKSRNAGIIVMAATNNGEVLDEALLRPGRFTRQYHVVAPATSRERLDVLQKLFKRILEPKNFALESPMLLDQLARLSGGLSPDHLKDILIRASDLAKKESRKQITEKDAFEAFQRQQFGPPSSDPLSKDRLELIAFHEMGHAIVAAALGLSPLIVSMKARGTTGGRVIIDSDALTEPPPTRTDYLKGVLLNAGGRAGELALGEDRMSVGVKQDFDNARYFCRQMIEAGMIGARFGGSDQTRGDGVRQESPEVSHLIDQIIQLAINCGGKIIEILGKDDFRKLVDDSIALEVELIGEQAAEFFRVRIDAATREKMAELTVQFLKDCSALKINQG